MPRYEADPTKMSAGFKIFPKGEYEFIIGEPKAFQRTGQKGENWGIKYTLTCVTEGELKNTKYFQTLYLHSEAAEGINKQFLLAAEGYALKDEKRYNEDHLGADWSYDTDSGACGDAWRALTGKRVAADMDIKLDANTGNEQQVARFRPV